MIPIIFTLKTRRPDIWNTQHKPTDKNNDAMMQTISPEFAKLFGLGHSEGKKVEAIH